MELIKNNQQEIIISAGATESKGDELSPFIESNTKQIRFKELRDKCIIPVFAKDNEKSIAHHELIETVFNQVNSVFTGNTISPPEIRVSHQIKGRIPEAIHKHANELLEYEKTQYFERMAFIIRIPSITTNINGNSLSLVVGGVRAYNRENLYSKKSLEKFQVFIGFQNMVCCNLCISTDGFKSELRASEISELGSKINSLLHSYQKDQQIEEMKSLENQYLNEREFAHLIGRMKLYQYLPKELSKSIPELLITDGQIASIAKDYYTDKRFCRNEDEQINMWNLYNLFTSSVKSSYIDSFVGRNANSFDFVKGVNKALNSSSEYDWYLN